MATNYKSTAQSKTPYMDLYSAFEEQTKKKGNTYKTKLKEQYDVSRGDGGRAYDTSAEEQYVNYMQQQRALPEELASAGITGGAAESSLIRLKAGYGQGLGNIERQRASSLSDLQKSYMSSLSDYEQAQTQQLEDAYARYMEKQAAYDEQLRQEELARQEAQKEQEMEDFLNTYQSMYTNKSAIQSAINTLANSDDLNKDRKIAYLKAYRNALVDAYSSSSRGGSSGSSSSGSGGGGTDTSQQDDSNRLVLQQSITHTITPKTTTFTPTITQPKNLPTSPMVAPLANFTPTKRGGISSRDHPPHEIH